MNQYYVYAIYWDYNSESRTIDCELSIDEAVKIRSEATKKFDDLNYEVLICYDPEGALKKDASMPNFSFC